MTTLTIANVQSICQANYDFVNKHYEQYLRNPHYLGVLRDACDTTRRNLRNLSAGKLQKADGTFVNVNLPTGASDIISSANQMISNIGVTERENIDVYNEFLRKYSS